MDLEYIRITVRSKTIAVFDILQLFNFFNAIRKESADTQEIVGRVPEIGFYVTEESRFQVCVTEESRFQVLCGRQPRI